MNLRAIFWIVWAGLFWGGVGWIVLGSPSWLALFWLWFGPFGGCVLCILLMTIVTNIRDARHRRRYRLPTEPYDYTLLRNDSRVSSTANQGGKRS